MSYNRKTIADLKDGDTVWIHDRYGGMMCKGKFRTTELGEEVVSEDCELSIDRSEAQGTVLEQPVLFGALGPIHVYTSRQECQDNAWAIYRRGEIAKAIESTDIRTLKRIGKLLGIVRPSKHHINR